jgi:hypothetical protein
MTVGVFREIFLSDVSKFIGSANYAHGKESESCFTEEELRRRRCIMEASSAVLILWIPCGFWALE